MTTADWLVLAGGAAAIGWVNWYFFLADRGAADVSVREGGAQEVVIIVAGGYSPDTIRLRVNRPARLVFDRREDDSCTDEIVLRDFGLRRFLPAHRRTVIDLTPTDRGTFEFTCGMGMHRGNLVVE